MRAAPHTLKAELIRNLRLYHFDEPDIDGIIGQINAFDAGFRRDALALCVTFSRKSARIVPKLLVHIVSASGTLSPDDVRLWILHAFDLLDSSGIEPAVRFLSRTAKDQLRSFVRPSGLALEDVLPRLDTYIRAVSGRDFGVKPTDGPCTTDGESIWLPARERTFHTMNENYLIYKLASVYAWAQTAHGTLTPHGGEPGRAGGSGLEALISGFKDRALAIDLYCVLEAVRLRGVLERELPGLMREAAKVMRGFLERRLKTDDAAPRTLFVEGLFRWFLSGGGYEDYVDIEMMDEACGVMLKAAESPGPSPDALEALYGLAAGLPGPYEPVEALRCFGRLDPQLVSARRQETAARIRGVIERIIEAPEMDLERPQVRPQAEEPPARQEGERKFLLIKGALIELDEDLASVIREKGGDLPGTLVEGADAAGHRSGVSLRALLEMQQTESEAGDEGVTGIKYDEWDFTRGGYRKGWCTLHESEIHPGGGSFVDEVARRYGGHILSLRREFELMRSVPGILRRQPEGEDIDVDATVEALADLGAGIPPGENLYKKLDRRERDIAALLLLDQSGSTKGWVNTAQKESLVLMCEALQALGDRYAIFGFSGMTRNRCEFYRIKAFKEPYSDMVKRRIAGIEPKDYTRMGPPIRHAARILNGVDAVTRLLIVLSDGKPEDYDAYKGEYGIEDTRMALVEAKRLGIHSFCITIDTEALSYIPYMYGEVNYTFIDDVRKLPGKLSQIYSRITT